MFNELVKILRMAVEKGPHARLSVRSGVAVYVTYVECPAKHNIAADGIFCDATMFLS